MFWFYFCFRHLALGLLAVVLHLLFGFGVLSRFCYLALGLLAVVLHLLSRPFLVSVEVIVAWFSGSRD